MMNKKPSRTKSDKRSLGRFVVDGYERAIDGIEAEVRPEIEKKYADEWNASGLVKRWLLSRQIEKEIAVVVTERSKHISPDTLF